MTAVALGAVSLAGAFPAVVAQVGGSWWRRALFGAAGFCVCWSASPSSHTTISTGYRRRSRRAAGADWPGQRSGLPPRPFSLLLRTRRFPMVDVLLCVVWSAAVVMGVEAVGATPLRGDVPGALVGTLIVAWQPLLTILEETRRPAGIHRHVA